MVGASHAFFNGNIHPDDFVVGQERSRGVCDHGPAAKADHAVMLECLGHVLGFEFAELFFTEVRVDLAAWFSLVLFDEGVGVNMCGVECAG